MIRTVFAEVGLGEWPSFIRDRIFILSLLAGVCVWSVLWFTVVPTFSVGDSEIVSIIFFTVVWYPVLEEILFRGVIQKHLFQKKWARKSLVGMSVANWMTSLLFVVVHVWYQSVLWAMMVLVPSLIYGFFRDKYESTYPAIILHVFYNAGFVGVNILSQ